MNHKNNYILNIYQMKLEKIKSYNEEAAFLEFAVVIVSLKDYDPIYCVLVHRLYWVQLLAPREVGK